MANKGPSSGPHEVRERAHLVDRVPDFDEPMDEGELAPWEGKR